MEIWEHAQKHELIIITNDEDFLNLLLSKGVPPKVILLRTGNQSTQSIADLLIKRKSDVSAFYEDNEIGVLQIF